MQAEMYHIVVPWYVAVPLLIVVAAIVVVVSKRRRKN